jgi:CRISPR/Cas system CSM-associated protein Csm4 (group 5 of RAMP superfamily)
VDKSQSKKNKKKLKYITIESFSNAADGKHKSNANTGSSNATIAHCTCTYVQCACIV